MFEELLKKGEELSKRKDFKPFTNLPSMKVVPPIRKTVKRIGYILAHTEGLPLDKRVEYAKLAGVKLKEGDNELENLYDDFTSQNELAIALFNIKDTDNLDFDELNEGEVNAALQVFFMKRRGI